MKVPLVEAQVKAIAIDLMLIAVKTGMLFNSEIILQVAQAIKQYSFTKLVVAPVMVSPLLK